MYAEKVMVCGFKKVVLFLRNQKLELEPLSLDVSIDVPTNRRDFFEVEL